MNTYDAVSVNDAAATWICVVRLGPCLFLRPAVAARACPSLWLPELRPRAPARARGTTALARRGCCCSSDDWRASVWANSVASPAAIRDFCVSLPAPGFV